MLTGGSDNLTYNNIVRINLDIEYVKDNIDNMIKIIRNKPALTVFPILKPARQVGTWREISFILFHSKGYCTK